MRLFLFPISTRRSLIYCQRLNTVLSEQQSLIDKGTARAAKLWASWEKKESGWQKKVVDLGNKALTRIPYEEWGLKSIPPLSARRREEELSGKEKVELCFPSILISEKKALETLRVLGTEREWLHKSRMIYSFIGMPITAPMALIPFIPNIPFFYLVYRAWSHWRSLSGSKHIQFLLEHDLVNTKPSPVLDVLYSAGIMRAKRDNTLISALLEDDKDGESKSRETMVLQGWNSKVIAQALEVPELEVELERAIWQVENSLREREGSNEGTERKT